MQTSPIRYLFLLTIIIHAGISVDPTLSDTLREFDRLFEITTKNSERAVTLLNNEGQMIRELSNAEVNIGANLINRESRNFVVQLETIRNKTAAEQVNVTTCFQSTSGTLLELKELSQLELATCINRYTNDGSTVISQGLGNLNTIITSVYVLKRSLDTCQPTDNVCIGYVYSEVQFQQFDIPRKIQEQLDITGRKVEDDRLRLGDCGIRSAENLARYGSAVIAEVERCIDEIIHPKP